MNIQAYAIKDKYFLPERVFFCNLFNCCHCKKEDLLGKIKALMEKEIENYTANIFENICCAEKLNKQKPGNDECLLPSDFIKFVKKNYNKQTLKQEGYLLTKCYEQVSSAAFMANEKYLCLLSTPLGITQDKEILACFKSICQDAEPLSLRDLNRMLQPIGTPLPSPNSSIHSYSRNQNNVVNFAIQKVFPLILIHSDRSSLSLLTSHNWHDIVCKYNAGTGFQSCVIEVNPSIEEEFRKIMHSCFDKLTKIAELPNEEQLTEDVGKLLLKIYNTIIAYHQNGMLLGVPDQRSKCPDDEHIVQPVDDEAYQYDGLISTHITNLMEWTYIVHKDTRQFMEYIDRIIDKIRAHILKQLNATFSMDELRKFQKDGEPSNSLFLWRGNEHLLRLLIHAMHDEAVVCNNMQIGG